MREELEALAYELKEWRREGVTTVPVAEATMQRLRERVAALAAAAPAKPAPAAEEVLGPGDFALPPAPPPAVEAVAPAPVLPDPPRVDVPEGDKATQIAWLRDRVLSDLICQEQLKPGKQLVFGVGSVEADIFFCGEAPGAEEEVQGEPFVGPAGQLLTKIIGAMGLSRETVYITNIMSWRPDIGSVYGNRPPNAAEMAYCLPFVRAQLAIVRPKIIVALGKTAVDGLLGADPTRRMGRIRGQWSEFAGIPLLPTFHPSYLLRNQAKATKRLVWEDMMAVMERLELPISDKQRGFFL